MDNLPHTSKILFLLYRKHSSDSLTIVIGVVFPQLNTYAERTTKKRL